MNKPTAKTNTQKIRDEYKQAACRYIYVCEESGVDSKQPSFLESERDEQGVWTLRDENREQLATAFPDGTIELS